MVAIDIPARFSVRVHATVNAGYPQIYNTNMIYRGARYPLDHDLNQSSGVIGYLPLPERWQLEVIGMHIVYGTRRYSLQAPVDQSGSVVVIGYDDSGGPGIDYTNLVVYVEKIAGHSVQLYSAKNFRLFELIGAGGAQGVRASDLSDTVRVPPTRLDSSLLRGHEGSFGAPRGGGKKHQGVDIVANQSSNDKSTYEVYATAAGTVAYARINGSDDSGYGHTVVVDHRNGFYTLYAHLAIDASSGVVSLGDDVEEGEVVGYLADLENGELSSGNARRIDPYDKIQLHFECFEADPGLSSDTQLALIKGGAAIDDPTARLLDLGYVSF